MQMNEIIKGRRKELGMTQEQMADFLGVTPSAVHKWEKGSCYPDVTSLPALARLLEVDLNTLFSFEDDFTEEEMDACLDQALIFMREQGYEEGFRFVMGRIREFPTCGLFLYKAASFLDGTLILYHCEKADSYEEQIEHLYKLAIRYGEDEVRDRSNYMLVLKYLRKREFEKAENVLDALPETEIDKQRLRATLCLNQGRVQDAVEILEEKLQKAVVDVNNNLILLMNCFLKVHRDKELELCVEKIRGIQEEFCLWEYQSYLAECQLGIYQQDKDRTLEALRRMLESMYRGNVQDRFPLFPQIAEPMKGEGKKEKNHSGVDMLREMAFTLVDALKKENGLDGDGFLQGDGDLEELLREFGRKNGKNRTYD